MAIVFGLLGLVLVAVVHFVFGQPVTAGLLALVAGCSLCAAAVTLWRFSKDHPDAPRNHQRAAPPRRTHFSEVRLSAAP